MSVKKKKPLINEAGQAMIEYMLLIAVVVAIASSVFTQLERRLISGPNSFQKKYLGGYSKMFSGYNGSFQGQYQRFTIRR